MKSLSRIFTACVMLGIAFAQILPVHASPAAQTLTSNPKAEDYVRTEVLAGRDADLSKEFPDISDRVISADFIVSLWNDPAAQKLTRFKIYFATIVGDIEAEGISIPFNVEFHNCTFEGEINLASATVKTFRIDDSTVNDAVKMGRMLVGGDLALYQSTFQGEVTLFGADINKNLLADRSRFFGKIPDPNSKYTFELWTTHVEQTAEFTDAIIRGDVGADDAKIDVDMKFDGVVFEKPASFRSIQVGNIANFAAARFNDVADFDSSTVALDANFENVKFIGTANFANFRVGNLADFSNVLFYKDVSFNSSVMNRDVLFTAATFNGNATLDDMTITRYLYFDNTELNQDFSFQYPTVGWPYFAGTTFNGKVNFEGVQATKDLDFTDANYNYPGEPFAVTLAEVAGAGIFMNFTAPAGLQLNDNQFGSLTISGADNRTFKSIDLDSTKVDGSLDFENINTDTFSAQGFSAGDATTFNNVTITDSLDLSNASLGVFTLDKKFWPQIPDKPDVFNVHGMSYSDIIVAPELNENNWQVLENMVEDATYSPQAYHTLEQFLTEKGSPDWAADVEFHRKNRERDHVLKAPSGAWFWSWFLSIFSGYGQRPQYAFGWSLLVIIIGAIVFWKEDDLVMLGDENAQPPYNPFLFSFALFIPYIELGIADKWDPKPERKFAWTYKHIHRMLGWILTPIALLTFGGIIK
jgi:hypothetical protein